MPFLAGLAVPLISGAVSSAAGAGISSLLQGGTGGKQTANIQTPTTADQTNAAYNESQKALAQQHGLVQQLQAQNGIGNQSNVYNQQQALANQLGLMAQGQGPNPALAQLNQTTGQNVANQAALMAGQRGAGANAGLIAREAAQQGAATQQQAVGQAATLRANQQLAAIGALQQQQNMLGNLATTQVGQQQQAIGSLNQLTQNEQQQLLASISGQNQAALGQSGQNIQQQQFQQGQASKIAGGLASGLGTGLQSLLSTGNPSQLNNAIPDVQKQTAGIVPDETQTAGIVPQARGGLIKAFAEGGQIGSQAILKENYKGPKSKIGRMFAQGGKVEALVSPGEIYLTPNQVKKVEEGKASPLSGEKIPGKPKVKGAKNSYANDTVHKTLREGGMILPRSVTQSKEPEKNAKLFLAKELAKKGKR